MRGVLGADAGSGSAASTSTGIGRGTDGGGVGGATCCWTGLGVTVRRGGGGSSSSSSSRWPQCSLVEPALLAAGDEVAVAVCVLPLGAPQLEGGALA